MPEPERITSHHRGASARRAGIAFCVLALAVCFSASLSGPAGAKPRSAQRIYWGASIGDQITGEKAPWDMRPVRRFQRKVSKPLSLIGFSAPFSECGRKKCAFVRFPGTPLDNVRHYGAIPFFSWSSASSPPKVHEPKYQLSDVINGRYDSYIRYFAKGAKAWGHPFFMRFNWEMNGFWFPWAEWVNGNHKGEYVRAWRHVHNIFTSVGATNVSWVWCPNVDVNGGLGNLRSEYPGSAYVDWTCLDGFNWGHSAFDPGWKNFDQIFRSTYRRVRRIAPNKPMVLGEFASSDNGGSKVRWIRHTFATIPRHYRKIRGLVWYDVIDRDSHWPIERPHRVTRAFRRAIGPKVFVTNRFGSISASPIRPPGAHGFPPH